MTTTELFTGSKSSTSAAVFMTTAQPLLSLRPTVTNSESPMDSSPTGNTMKSMDLNAQPFFSSAQEKILPTKLIVQKTELCGYRKVVEELSVPERNE